MTRDSIDFDALALHQPCLVMRTDFRIVWVSDAYRRDTPVLDRRIVGHDMFDVFPDNPRVFDHDSVQNLRASLQAVLRRGQRDPMPIQRRA